MKKILAIVLAISVLLTLCASFAFAEGDSGKISFYFWDQNQKDAMQGVVDIFNKDYPNIEVELTVVPWAQYWAKMQTSLNSANGPDVFWLNFSFAYEYIPMGLVEPLDEYIAADGVDLSVFPDSLRGVYSLDGKTYGIPKDYDTIGLFYYKPIFDEAGVEYPTDDWTWDDMYAAAQKIAEAGYAGLVFDMADTQGWTFDLFSTNDVNIMSEDESRYIYNQPGVAEAFNFSRKLIDEGLTPTYAQCQETIPNERFQAGMAGMIWAGSWNCQPYIDALGVENLGVVEIPSKVKEGNVIHGLGICISAASEHKDLAWKFVKYFATKEAAEAQAGVVIPAHTDGSAMWADRFSELGVDCFLKAATEYAIPIPTAKVKTANQDDIVSNYTKQIWSGSISVEDGIAKIDEEITALLAE